MIAELRARREASGLATGELISIFFGGGTPSLWDASQIGRVIDALEGSFDRAAANLEVTVECNPTSLDASAAKALADAGVNRLSVGAQSLDDRELRFLGRLHDASTAVRALEDARAAIDRVSADLIFGLPDQSVASFVGQIGAVVSLGVEHVSAYSLTIEPATQFGALHDKGKLPLAIEDDVAEMFIAAERAFEARSMRHYEVSNYARRGAEARHNLHYWRGGDYLGLGAGAVGAISEGNTARRYRNEPRPERYLGVAELDAIEIFEETLGPRERVREALMLGLRTAPGVDLERLAARIGIDPRRGRERALARRAERGDIVLTDAGVLRVPPSRWLHLDAIVRDLF